jgi:hypothetical protein
LAETFSVALATIAQSEVVPEHAPPQPTNVCPDAGAALRVTVVPSGNVWLQLFGPTHCSPVGLDVTVPEPPMEIMKAAACADGVDAGPDVPLAPFEEPPPPHAAIRPTTEHAAPKRSMDMVFTAHEERRSWRGECSALARKRKLPANSE